MMKATEYNPIADIYADDISHIEICGPNVRFVFFTWANGGKVIVAKVIRPISSVRQKTMDMIAEARAEQSRQMQLALH